MNLLNCLPRSVNKSWLTVYETVGKNIFSRYRSYCQVRDQGNRVEIIDNRGVKIEVSVVNALQIQALFQQQAQRTEIAFKYLNAGCEARAHAMVRDLEAKGIIAGKVFIEGIFKIPTPIGPRRYTEWTYHVAPVVAVRQATGKVDVYALDPSLFNRATLLSDWINFHLKESVPQEERVSIGPRFSYMPGDLKVSLSEYNSSRDDQMKETLKACLFNQAWYEEAQ